MSDPRFQSPNPFQLGGAATNGSAGGVSPHIGTRPCPGQALVEARAALSGGDERRAMEIARQIWPETPENTRGEWIILAIEAGEVQWALERIAQVPEPARTLIQTILDDTSEPGDASDPYEVDATVLRPKAQADRETVELFLRFFGGRRDVYAKAWFDDRRRRAGYHPVEQPLTDRVARAHLQGAMTVGQYLLFPDGTCTFAAIDLDVAGTIMDTLRAGHGEDVSPLEHAPLREIATRMIDSGARLGLPMFAEDSGGRGVHLWLFVEPAKTARAVRSALAQVIGGAGPVPPGVGVELYPKQEKIGPRGLSSLVKLPLGVHPATLRRCALLDDHLRPIDDPLVSLQRLRIAPADAVDAVVGRRVVALPAPELEPSGTVPRLVETPSARSLAEVLRAVPAGAEERTACERMLFGCAILRRLTRKAYEQHALDANEARSLVYSLGLVGPGPGLIDEILASAQIPRRELDRLRRGLPSPVGCSKLRAMLSEGSPCSCFAGAEAQPYATPVLHAVGPVKAAEPRWKPFAAYLEADESVVAHPLEQMGASLERIERRLEELEKGRR